MHVLRAASAGFCLGVSLALRRLDKELASFMAHKGKRGADRRLITLGPIIHNPLVMQGYTEQGVLCESDPEGVGSGDRVVIRAHGIPREVEEALKASGAGVVDATCPKVKRAQTAIGRERDKGGILLLFGEKEHPEVRGLLSYAGPDALVFGSLEELERLPLDRAAPYFLAAQTTQERSILLQGRERLSEMLQRNVRCLDTICDATRNRQQEAINLAENVDIMVIVGGLNSGNTRRLAEVSRSRGVPAIHVEQISDLSADMLDMLRAAKSAGLTAGASTPEEHINAMQDFLEKLV
ncbi:4-hydroxy-3-methylbut-2-enyl diphosphate reductase [Desulfovibrio sp. OttesenSCG-928-A18]|nr:4-hydroxy-3-methylbut-2-enyl diphosphate reductase [Desulfovibrio sp. OttesenSCG-928-A18]